MPIYLRPDDYYSKCVKSTLFCTVHFGSNLRAYYLCRSKWIMQLYKYYDEMLS